MGRAEQALAYSYREDASGNSRLVPMTAEVKSEIEEEIQDSLTLINKIRENLFKAGYGAGISTKCLPLETISRWDIETIEIDDDNKTQPLRLKVVKK